MKLLKSVAVAAVLAGSSLFFGGCAEPTGGGFDFGAPPAYNGCWENAQRIFRYMDYDRAQMIDDFDRDVTMTRPHSTLTYWNLAHHD